MEFHEKLQKLRTQENLTQEELAQKLYVSRAAVSKWESGRGYPSIDSLKAIANYFGVTIDQLIRGEEMVALAEQDITASSQKHTTLVCGVLDCLTVLLLFLPVFGDGWASVTLPAMARVSGWLKTAFLVTVSLTAANGLCTVVVGALDGQSREKRLKTAGIVLSLCGTLLFILARQPYAGSFYLLLLAAKGFLLQKGK